MNEVCAGYNVREIAEKCGLSLATAYRIAGGRFSTANPKHVKAREMLAASGMLEKRRNPAETLQIGFSGYMPIPEPGLFYQAFRSEKTMAAFAARNIVPRYIPYPALKVPALANELLDGLDALMISTAFLDPETLPVVRTFSGRVLVTDIQFICEALPASQMLPELHPALSELDTRFGFGGYRRIVLLSGAHPNAHGLEHMIRSYFTVSRQTTPLETVFIEQRRPEAAEAYFRANPNEWEGTLFLSLSEYFSRGVRAAFGEAMPDLINFDNYESYQSPGEEGFFTSVDFDVERIVREEIALLFELDANRALPDRIVKVPAYPVIRKSVRGGTSRA